jgi:hypothetical protein
MKKNIYLILLLAFVITSGYTQGLSIADQGQPTKKWKRTHFYVSLGLDWAKYENMSADRIVAFANNPDLLEKSIQGMEAEVSSSTAGAALIASIGFAPFSTSNNSFLQDQELRLGISLQSPKEAMLSFKNESLDTSVVYCNIQSEVALETAYLFKGDWGKRFHWYVGAGINAGLTFDNQMIVMSGEYFDPNEHPSTQESLMENRVYHGARQVFNIRAYIPYGIYYRITNGFALGFEARRGFGWQFLSLEESNRMRRAGAFMLSARF